MHRVMIWQNDNKGSMGAYIDVILCEHMLYPIMNNILGKKNHYGTQFFRTCHSIYIFCRSQLNFTFQILRGHPSPAPDFVIVLYPLQPYNEKKRVDAAGRIKFHCSKAESVKKEL